jgi:hypothetical protein
MNLNDYPAEFWYCSVSMNRKDGDSKEKVVNDLTFEELYNQIIAPWHQQNLWKSCLARGRFVAKNLKCMLC